MFGGRSFAGKTERWIQFQKKDERVAFHSSKCHQNQRCGTKLWKWTTNSPRIWKPVQNWLVADVVPAEIQVARHVGRIPPDRGAPPWIVQLFLLWYCSRTPVHNGGGQTHIRWLRIWDRLSHLVKLAKIAYTASLQTTWIHPPSVSQFHDSSITPLQFRSWISYCWSTMTCVVFVRRVSQGFQNKVVVTLLRQFTPTLTSI